MMCKGSDTVCKLECINKFSVAVSYQFGKQFLLKLLLHSPFMRTCFFRTLPILLAFLYLLTQTIWRSPMPSLQKFGWKV